MNLEKLNPWNWFKHEDNEAKQSAQIPVHREDAVPMAPALWRQGQHPMLQMHQQIDRLFDDVFSAFGLPYPTPSSASPPLPGAGMIGGYRPQIDVSGDEHQYEITLDVPGLSQEDLSIEVKGDVLVIQGQKQERNEQKEKKFYRVERSYGAFQRTLSLPVDSNVDAIDASLKGGVLTLAIPRLEADQDDVKRIPITAR
jgi:HSP20 family protein